MKTFEQISIQKGCKLKKVIKAATIYAVSYLSRECLRKSNLQGKIPQFSWWKEAKPDEKEWKALKRSEAKSYCIDDPMSIECRRSGQ